MARFDHFMHETLADINLSFFYYVESGIGSWEMCLNGIDCKIGKERESLIVHVVNKYHGVLIYRAQYSILKFHDCVM